MPIRVILRLLLGGLLLAAVVAACQPTRETQIVIEMTKPVTREVTVVVVVTATPGSSDGNAVAQSAPSDTPESTEAPTAPPTPTATPQPSPTTNATPDAFPTPVSREIVVAEQAFQNGKMFYLQPRDEIWVLINEGEDEVSGRWNIYDNEWEEGMPESDPSIEPPDDFVQPIRGFGKLWRENQAIRDALGWALDTEYGHWTQYEYYHGGEVNAAGEYVSGPGEHRLRGRDGSIYVFDENAGTWERIANNS